MVQFNKELLDEGSQQEAPRKKRCPEGYYKLQVDEGFNFRVNADNQNSKSYWVPMVVVAALNGSDEEGVGKNVYASVHVGGDKDYDERYYKTLEENQLFIAKIAAFSGLSNYLDEKYGEDWPVDNEQFAADLTLKLIGRTFDVKIIHKKRWTEFNAERHTDDVMEENGFEIEEDDNGKMWLMKDGEHVLWTEVKIGSFLPFKGGAGGSVAGGVSGPKDDYA